jgi:hypothetical protein
MLEGKNTKFPETLPSPLNYLTLLPEKQQDPRYEKLVWDLEKKLGVIFTFNVQVVLKHLC